jgi:hypothetical protein
LSTWIFQSNPEFYDIEGAAKALPIQTWLVNQYKTEIHNGDNVFLWQTGKDAGVY